jgi:hypothetical protein
MENDADWILVDDNDQSDIESVTSSSFEKIDQEDFDVKNKDTYVAALLENAKQSQQHRSVVSFVEKKEKRVNKRDDDHELMTTYIEPKPGSQYRNPRDKAGKNKAHKGKRRPSPLPKKVVNLTKVQPIGHPKLLSRMERQRDARQQCSTPNWKDYDD